MKSTWIEYYPSEEFFRTENENLTHPIHWLGEIFLGWPKETPEELKKWQEKWGSSWRRPQSSDVWFQILGVTYFGIFVLAIVLSKVM